MYGRVTFSTLDSRLFDRARQDFASTDLRENQVEKSSRNYQ